MIAVVVAIAMATGRSPEPARNWKDICSSCTGLDAYACAEHDLARLEQRLAIAYNKTLSTLPDEDHWDDRKTKPQLVKAQKAWFAYRDANCDFQGGFEGGIPQWVSTFSTDCKIAETKKRIAYLNHYSDQGRRN